MMQAAADIGGRKTQLIAHEIDGASFDHLHHGGDFVIKDNIQIHDMVSKLAK